MASVYSFKGSTIQIIANQADLFPMDHSVFKGSTIVVNPGFYRIDYPEQMVFKGSTITTSAANKKIFGTDFWMED